MTDPDVVVVGGGPAGLVLAWLLHRAGVSFLLVERQDRDAMGTTPRAGIVEYRTVELLREVGIADEVLTFDAVNREVEFRTPATSVLFDYAARTGGRAHSVFPQHRIVAELATALVAADAPLRFGHRVADVAPGNGPHERPTITVVGPDGTPRTLRPRVVVGADGASSAVARALAGHVEVLDRRLPSRWLVVSATTPPLVDRTVYGIHPRGYAAHLRRGPAETRFYLEVAGDVGPDDLPHDAIRAEIGARLGVGDALAGVPFAGVDVLDLRTRMTTPMQHGGLVLVGDAAHLITPAGGKGMNLAVADAVELAYGLNAAFGPGGGGDPTRLDAYSATRLPVIWRTQAFSDWFLRIITARSADALTGNDLDAGGAGGFVHGMREAWVRRLRDDPVLGRWFAHAYAGVDDDADAGPGP